MNPRPVLPLKRRKITLIILLCAVTFLLGLFAVFAFYRSAVIGTPASQVPPRLGIVVDQTMRVIYVEEGGAADVGGIEEGDILKRLNKRDLSAPQQARKALNRVDLSQKVTLILTRGNKEMTFEIQPAPIKGVQGAKTPTPVPPDFMYF